MPENHEKITREFCQGKVLIFYPKNEDEVLDIQKRLHEMGFQWPFMTMKPKNYIRTDPAFIKTCVEGGIIGLNRNGTIIWDEKRDPRVDEFLCTADQLRDDYIADSSKLASIFADAVSDRGNLKKPEDGGEILTMTDVWNAVAGNFTGDDTFEVSLSISTSGSPATEKLEGVSIWAGEDILQVRDHQNGTFNVGNHSYEQPANISSAASAEDTAIAFARFYRSHKKAAASGQNASRL